MAADVDLAAAIDASEPLLAAQVRDPRQVLLPPAERPARLRRPFCLLDTTYGELVRSTVRAGMQVMRPRRTIMKHHGRAVMAGGFAVPKSDVEDRTISPMDLNELLDRRRLCRPRFAYVPLLRSCTAPREGRLLVSKRDARHFFHHLRSGKRWRKWMAHPAPPSCSRVPCHRSLPMGFSCSPGWAQAFTDACTAAAELPEDRRVHPDREDRACLLVWASIMDDLWAIEQRDLHEAAEDGPRWLSRAAAEWELRGVPSHPGKAVDGAEAQEVQGYFVHSRLKWVGVSLPKRRLALQATWHCLMEEAVPGCEIDRLVGKHGFCHSVRAPLRSIFEASYTWLPELRRRPKRLMRVPPAVWAELACSMLLLPVCQFDLAAPWSARLECTDSSMTGIGRSWAVAEPSDIARYCRAADAKGLYTNLALPFGVEVDPYRVCPLRRVQLPLGHYRWRHLGVPLRPRHITLGEAEAALWAITDRLRRPEDGGCRSLHPLGSAALTWGV